MSKKLKTLDRSKPFDNCHGYDPLGRRFMQDGAYFNVDGDEVTETEEPSAEDTGSVDGGEIEQLKVDLATAQTTLTETESELAEVKAQLATAVLEKNSLSEQLSLITAELKDVTAAAKPPATKPQAKKVAAK